MTFDYKRAQLHRQQMSAGSIKREIERIAGRFVLAERINKGKIVVGFVGNAYGDDLTELQLQHICGFYGFTDGKIDVETVRDYPCTKKYMRGLNDYIIITRKEA